MTAISTITTEELDRRFDEGEDLNEHFDLDDPIISYGEEPRRVNFNFPAWLVDALDKEAKHLAISRQAVAIVWLADRAKQEGLAQ